MILIYLSNILNNKYGLMSTVVSAGHKDRGDLSPRSRILWILDQYYIYIPKRSIKLLNEIVKDYMHPSMLYKLNNY